MTIDTNTIVSVTEANQNFSRVTRIAETNGQAVICLLYTSDAADE